MFVPYYGDKKGLEKTYENNDYTWIHISKFLSVLDENVLKDFEDLNWFDVDAFWTKEYIEKCKKYPPVNVDWDNFVEFKDFLFSAKMLFMTWFTCKYGYWKKWELNKTSTWKLFTHHWIDLVLPKWTPIISFSSGYVKIAENIKGYWNCVVIESVVNNETLFFCYEHLDSLNVLAWEKVKKWDIIWTCWNTWNSSWYHLHFQIDKDTWSFHPYWGSWEDNVEQTLKNCIDPWEFLRSLYLWKNNNEINSTSKKQDNKNLDIKQTNTKINNKNIKKQKDDNFDIIWTLVKEIDKNSNTKEDMKTNLEQKLETNTETNHSSNEFKNIDFIDSISDNLEKHSNDKDYINFFVNAWILKWENWNYELESPLTRYQITLIIYRLYKAWLLKINKNKVPCNLVKFNDITENLKMEEEFSKALEFAYCNSIITWDHNNFLPWNKLTWEEFLAILWRLFAGLKNSSWEKWYENYYNWAINKKLINSSWYFIWKPITRKEVFSILYKLILF